MIESIVLAQTYGGRSGGFLKTVAKPGPSATIERQAGMEIFTSYYGRTKQLRKAGIEPVAISRGVPKWYDGASYQALAPTVDFEWKTVQLTFLNHQATDLNRLCEKAAKADVELVVPMEEFEPFCEALRATKKYGDVKNAGAAVWLMTRSALRELGEDDGRAYTPIMRLFGRAAIPETTAKGVKALIDQKMKTGEIENPWEIFECLLGRTYGASGRKAD